MEKEQIRAFLSRVATEQAYRVQLEQEPVQTLAALGVEIAPSDVPPEGVTLPTNEEILEKLDAMTDVLFPRLCLRFFRFFRH